MNTTDPTVRRALRIVAHPLLVRLALDGWEQTDPLPRCPKCSSPLLARSDGGAACPGCVEEAARAV